MSGADGDRGKTRNMNRGTTVEHRNPSMALQKEKPQSAKRAMAYDAAAHESPLSAKELELMHAYWRACNYLSFAWLHLNRMIVKYDLDVVYVAGPGHGAPGVLGPAYLEGT